MLASTALSQTSLDSVQTISLARWKVVRLYEIARSAASCDSLQAFQEKEIQAGIKLQSVTDSLLTVTTDELVAARADRGMADSQLKNQKALTKDQARKKRRWMLISAGILAVWIGSEVVF